MRVPLHVRDWPLRWKIVALLVMASTLPLAIEALIEFRNARLLILKGETELLTARGDQVVGEVDAFHRTYQRSASRLARLPDIVRYSQTSPAERGRLNPAIRATLEIWPRSDPAIRGAGLLGRDGTVTASTEPALIGQPLAFHRYVQDALRGAPVISDLHLAGPEVGAVPTIAYLVPVRGPDEHVVGVVILWIRATALWSILESWNGKAGEKSFSVLFDQFGVRIAHSYNQEIVFHPGALLDPGTVAGMVAEKRFGENTRELLEAPRLFPEQFDRARSPPPLSRDIFRGFAPVNQQWNYGVPRRLETVPWTLFYMIPERSLEAPVASLTRRMVLFTVLIIGLAFLVGMLFAAGILRPIKLLSAAAETLSRGHLSARVAAKGADELGRLGGNFNTMADRLEAMVESEKRTNKELEAFSYSVAHDLRAPLRSIDAFSQILLEDHATQLNEEGQTFLRTVRESTQQMGQLIDDLLNLSRVSRAEMRKETVDLSRMAEMIVETLRTTQPEHAPECQIERGMMALGDPHLLHVALNNLLGNAWKYTSKRARARIEVGRMEQSGQVTYFVRDNGAGFDMTYAHKLFGVFQRLHTGSEFPGTGIGLVTVQRIIQRHGGQIWAEGAVEQGATFYFTLKHESGGGHARQNYRPGRGQPER